MPTKRENNKKFRQSLAENNVNQVLTEMRDEVEKLIKVGGSDATSSELKYDFHDLPYAGLLAAARRFHLGHYKHGRFNWKKGNSAFCEERIKHLAAHVALFIEFRKQDDLDAILCNAMMIADYNARGLMSSDPQHDFMMDGKEVKLDKER